MRRARQKPKTLSPTSKSDDCDFWLWANFFRFNGYGDLSRNLAIELNRLTRLAIQAPPTFYQQLHDLGLWSRVRSNRLHKGPTLSIQPTFSQMLPPRAPGSVIYTMFECDRLLPAWREKLSKFDLVLMPSNENAFHFRDQLRAPIAVVPLGIDFDHYHFQPPKKRSIFRFGTAGHLGHGATRKGLFRVVEWFLDAFPPRFTDVRLSIKLNRGFEEVETHGDPRIELFAGDLSTQALADWHHSLDVYADGSTYEGWGMFPCNSLACGRAVVGTYYGARREYLRFGNHVSIGYRIKLADEKFQHLGGAWAVPDHSDGVEALRWCYNNPAEVERMGERAAESVHHLTWRRCAEGVLSEMKKAGIFRQ